MPTPMPTIAAVGVAQSGTSRTRRSSPPSAIAMPSPKTAVRSGRPIATAEPKVSSRIRAAATKPITSPPTGAACDFAATGPPASTRGFVTGGQDWVDERLGLCGRVLVHGLVERDQGVCGPAVSATPGWRRLQRMGWRPLSHAGRRRAHRRCPPPSARTMAEEKPSSAWKTTCTVSPARCGNCSLQGLCGSLRLRAGLEVVLLGLPAERAREREGRRECGDPKDDDQTALPVAPVSCLTNMSDSSS